MMALESSFVPFPSEVVMIPAGYLASKGEMNIFTAILCGIAGSLVGALFNYYLAVKLGRPLLIQYGRYVMFSEMTMQKMEIFFARQIKANDPNGSSSSQSNHFNAISFNNGAIGIDAMLF